MPGARTEITEIATALGVLRMDLNDAIANRPSELRNVPQLSWDRLAERWRAGEHADAYISAFANGRAFLEAADALNGRRPRLVEWTGGRRPPGDEVVPADLRIDHVYLVSCKYLSRVLQNASPARLVEGLLTNASVDSTDWYQRVAPEELQELYATCARELGDSSFPAREVELTKEQRRSLAKALRGKWPGEAAGDYHSLCRAVSYWTAQMWSESIGQHGERMLWRLLRIQSAPYFILGHDGGRSTRLRIETPWDWRQSYRFRRLAVWSELAPGQPRVEWQGDYEVLRTGEERSVRGHVEVRWSHGRFGAPPEAKVYLDSPHSDVPGYHSLGESVGQGSLLPDDLSG